MDKMPLSPELLVANSVLNVASKDNQLISPMKLQKLIYFIYKRYLKKNSRPLFDEYFEVWQFGPVLPSVYREFKAYGASSITDYAYEVFDNYKRVYVINKKAKDFYDALKFVWQKYRHYNGTELSVLTHGKDTAWAKTLENNQLYIADEDIALERWKS